jgi:site-specific recombinase XerD
LKPENVSLCLTEEEVRQISTKGQLKSNKYTDGIEQNKKLTLTVEKVKESEQTLSARGRGNRVENDSTKLDKQAKRALKRKLQRQKKKELKKAQASQSILQNNRKEEKTPEKVKDSVDQVD